MAGEYSVKEQGWRLASSAMAVNRKLNMAGVEAELHQNDEGVWQVVTPDCLWAAAYADTWPYEPWAEAPPCAAGFIWVYNGPDGP